ncbi:divergent polysaccharide deacetylase family protein [Ferrimonas lipolytica]|uniref:Divergent polysaccharide deacetylase family protein n=1 Tax=Ferrimonas lipolytica TaxID=2724191 RepID=A0A6H1UI27_9GAMM|nr:divergent polysaccharide deacetylase family protein [Ferrimonas lipolytica]QIZ78260.1 divergent polysaccharide deacetylase family protein [Ferrimonas lipolytica]
MTLKFSLLTTTLWITKAVKWLVLSLLLVGSATAAQMALIIDDVGERALDKQTLALPHKVTLSFLPHSRFGRDFAMLGWLQQRELMLHLPMATVGVKDPGPWAITPNQDKWQVQYRVKKALADIPFVTGINNHMGSAVTPDPERMAWVMEEIAKKPMFFVDSLTTSDSQAHAQALRYGIDSIKRHVFLDPQPGIEVLEQQWLRAQTIALKYGKVVVIGHPYPDTMAFLQHKIPQLDQIELVSVAELISNERLAQSQVQQPATQ